VDVAHTAAGVYRRDAARDWPSRSAIVELLTQPWCALLVFGIVAVALWSVGNGTPFGYDSSEVYSTYLAAYNATAFANVNPLLQDQIASPNPAAHPYYGDSQPDLAANLVSQALIRVGIVDLRWHDLVAIGISIFGLFLAFISIRRMGGAVLATVVTLIFSATYVGILTRTSDILQAVHVALFWATVYVVQRYVETPTRAWLTAVVGAMFVVFFNDYTLALFIAGVAVLLVFQSELTSRSKLAFTLGCALAAGIAVGIWAMVEVATLGTWVVPPEGWGNLQTLGTGSQALLDLGQGALGLVIYPLIAAVIVCSVVRRARPEVVACLLVAGAIGATFWAQPGLVDELEIRPGVPLAHIVVLALVVALGVSSWRAFGSHSSGLLDLWTPSSPTGTGGSVTVTTFIVAVGVTTLLLSLLWTRDFVATFMASYKPSLVFAEDLLLAAALIALCRFALAWRQHRVLSLAAALLIALGGGYWLAYQAKLALQYPPLELSIASALRNNPAVQGMSFVSPGASPVVWYYTRGEGYDVSASPDSSTLNLDQRMFFRDRSTNADRYVHPQLFICATQHSQSCDVWRPLLAGLGFEAAQGGNFLETSDYLIYSSSAPPLANLEPVAKVDSVKLLVSRLDNGGVDLNATYTAHPANDSTAAPLAPLLRLYRVENEPCLVATTDSASGFQLPRDASGKFRISVTPRTSQASGAEVFSEPLRIGLSSFTLPDIQKGGVQQVVAASLEEAEQIALAAGTWNPSAGTLGAQSEPVPEATDASAPPSSTWARTPCS
jgi:hypothetical protein